MADDEPESKAPAVSEPVSAPAHWSSQRTVALLMICAVLLIAVMLFAASPGERPSFHSIGPATLTPSPTNPIHLIATIDATEPYLTPSGTLPPLGPTVAAHSTRTPTPPFGTDTPQPTVTNVPTFTSLPTAVPPTATIRPTPTNTAGAR